MSQPVQTGLERLKSESKLREQYKGNIGLLCHSASVDKELRHSLEVFIELFGDRVKKVYGPQHGFVTDVQDNMIETNHYTHPYFKLPIFSLYSETRIPTDEMLEGIDHLFVDLQDVGTRIYTYIYTLTLLLEKCAGKNIEVIVLDRPNPINAEDIEGNILNTEYQSFVGRHPIPVRHAMTMGEVGLMHQRFWAENKANYSVIEMKNYTRKMYFEETKLPWVMPSPNLPTVEGCFTFVGTVLFEGTNISEGRGTTHSLEIVGHPDIDPWTFQHTLNAKFKEYDLKGFKLRPINFQPTFQKHAGVSCGGFQIHITDRRMFKPWRVSQVLCREFASLLGKGFKYKEEAYEYEDDINPVDMINGDNRLRAWYENNGDYSFLDEIENEHMPRFLKNRKEILIY